MHGLIKNYMFGGDNCKSKLGLDMLPSQNEKIHFYGAETVPSKTYKGFLKTIENHCKKYIKTFGKTLF